MTGYVAGIDPGLAVTGIAVIDARWKLVQSLRVKSAPRVPLELRLAALSTAVTEVLSGRVTAVGVETQYWGGVSKWQGLETVVLARGAILAALGGAGIRVVAVPPRRWQQQLRERFSASRLVIKTASVAMAQVATGEKLSRDEADAYWIACDVQARGLKGMPWQARQEG